MTSTTLVAAQPALRFDRVRDDLQGIPRTAIIQRRMSDCLFCKIIAGEIPAAIVHQDDTLVAFKDINPQAPLHVLIVPQKHIASLNDLSPEDDALVGSMLRRAAALAKVARLPRARLPDGLQHEPRGGADGLSHPSAPARRSRPRLAARIAPSCSAESRVMSCERLGRVRARNSRLKTHNCPS